LNNDLKYLFFNKLSETLYGSVDVKTKPDHFYGQILGDFSLTNVVNPLTIERLNVSGAMDLAAGAVFTILVNGIYHFEFTALKDGGDPENLFIYLQVIGINIGIAIATSLPNYLALKKIRFKIEIQFYFILNSL